MLKIAAISDTHGRQGWEIPEADIFIHAGDMTAGGSRSETKKLAKFLKENQQVRHILLVPGNHDRCFEQQLQDVEQIFSDDPRVQILIDRTVEIEGKVFHGSPWTPLFFDWHFMADYGKMKSKLSNVPWSCDVLITHGPPYGHLDPGWLEPHVGSKALLETIIRKEPKVNVFGHLHAAGGQRKKFEFGKCFSYGTTQLYNLAAVDEAYQLKRGCTVFEI